MDNYNRIEQRLRNLDLDKLYLCSLEKDLQLLELEYQITGVSYDGVGGSGDISDSTGDKAANIIEKKKRIELRMARHSKEIEHLERVLELLTETEYIVVTMYYCKYKPIWFIAKEVDFSISQVKRIKKDAMTRLVRGVYGE